MALILGGFLFGWSAAVVYGLFGLGHDGLVLAYTGWSEVLPRMIAVIPVWGVVTWVIEKRKSSSPRLVRAVYWIAAVAPWMVFAAEILKWWPRASPGG
jgi:hypothetical protein